MTTIRKAQVTRLSDDHYRLTVQQAYGDSANAALTLDEARELFFDLARVLPETDVHDLAVEWACQG